MAIIGVTAAKVQPCMSGSRTPNRQNPIDWIKKFPGRQILLHLKDYGIINNERVMRPIGCGNLDWDGIFAAAEAAGVQYYIVEQDVCQKDPFDSLADSYKFITSRYVR